MTNNPKDPNIINLRLEDPVASKFWYSLYVLIKSPDFSITANKIKKIRKAKSITLSIIVTINL